MANSQTTGKAGAGGKTSTGAKGAKGRPAGGAAAGSRGGASGGRKGAAGTTQVGGYKVSGPSQRRLAPSTLALGAVLLVVLVVVVMVVVKVTSSSTPKAASGPTEFPAPAVMVRDATSVPMSLAGRVGLPSSVTPPQLLKGQPPLTEAGKPAVVYVGAEYCPYCAAERWALVMALSRFGTFKNLGETHSATGDVYPDTVTFSFYGSSYTSPYVSFDPTEMYTNQPTSSGYQTLQPLTGLAKKVFDKYDASPYVPASSTGAFPFADFGNKVLISGASYTPQLLAGLDDTQIAGALSNPSSPVAQAIVGTANYLTASICSLTGQKPASVCSAPVVGKAAHRIGL